MIPNNLRIGSTRLPNGITDSPPLARRTITTETAQASAATPSSTSSSIPTPMDWNRKGDDCMKQKLWDEALKNYEKAIQYADPQQHALLLVHSIQGLARAHLEKKNWPQAAVILNAALPLCLNEESRQSVMRGMAEIERQFLETVCEPRGFPNPQIYNDRRQKLNDFREACKSKLKKGEPVQKILYEFSESMHQFIAEMIKEGIQILGEPPCEFSILGLGSCARKEMSPYSDLEFAILIKENTPKNVAYFQKLTRWLELQVINLGETPCYIIPNQENLVVQGFCFDRGGNTPLGKAGQIELIQTPFDLAKLQSEKESNKADVLLRNTLQSTCLITGNNRLFQEYLKAMNGYLNEPSSKAPLTIRKQRSVEILKEHLRQFATRLTHKLTDTLYDVKAELYRLPSLFIASLGDYYEISEQNTWKRIEELVSHKYLSQKGGESLQDKALSKIMRLRMEAHFHYKKECDRVYHPFMQAKDPKRSQNVYILTDDDVKDIATIYQVINPLTRALQEVCDKGDFSRLAQESFWDESLVTHGEALKRARQFSEAIKHDQHALLLNDIDAHSKQVERAIIQKHGLVLVQDNAESYGKAADLLLQKGELDLALEYYEKAIPLHFPQTRDRTAEALIARGDFLFKKGDYVQAKENYEKAEKTYNPNANDQNAKAFPRVILINRLCQIYNKLNSPDTAYIYAMNALNLYDHYQLQVNGDKNRVFYAKLQICQAECQLKKSEQIKPSPVSKGQIVSLHTSALMNYKQAIFLYKRCLSKEHLTRIPLIIDKIFSLFNFEGYMESLRLAKQEKNIPLFCDILVLLAHIHQIKEEWSKAAKLLNLAFHFKMKEDRFLILASDLERNFLQQVWEKSNFVNPQNSISQRHELQQYRDICRDRLDRREPIPNILSYFTQDVMKVVDRLVQNSVSVLGPPPCTYAVIGLGSLARKEMSPFSNLKFAILVSDSSPDNVRYFRVLNQWLELQVINMGETPCDSYNLERENPKAPGFCFDESGHTPRERPDRLELIKTARDLAQLQSNPSYQKNFLLMNILLRVSFITGNQTLYKEYLQELNKTLNFKSSKSPLMVRQTRSLDFLKGYLTNIPKLTLKIKEPVYDVKIDLFRLPNLLIAAIADFFEINEANTSAVLTELVRRKVLLSEGAQNLQRAFDAAMHLRLLSQRKYQNVCDRVYHSSMLKNKNLDPENVYILTDDDLKNIAMIYRVTNPFIRALKEVCRTGRFDSLATQIFWDRSLVVQGEIYEKERQYEDALEHYQHALLLNPNDAEAQSRASIVKLLLSPEKAEDHIQKAMASLQAGHLGLAVESYEKALILLLPPRNPEAEACVVVGDRLFAQGDYSQALEQYKKAEEKYTPNKGEIHANTLALKALVYNRIGLTYLKINELELAYEKCSEAVHQYYLYGLEKADNKKVVLAKLLMSRGNAGCQRAAHNRAYKASESIEDYQEALQIYKSLLGERHPETVELTKKMQQASSK